MATNRDYMWLAAIVVIAAAAILLTQNDNYPVRLGLDLQGGLQVLLEADLPPEAEVDFEDMHTVSQIIDQRVNGLGVAESTVQVEGERRIVVELPGIDNPREALDLIQGTAQLEFVDTGRTPLAEGTCIRTSLNDGEPSPCEFEGGASITTVQQFPAPFYETVMTGEGIESAVPDSPQPGLYLVSFVLDDEAAAIFEEYTRSHLNQFLTIVLDKRVISSPQIGDVLSSRGQISGDFTLEEAQQLSLQLQYGSLPIPVRIESTRQVGASLGNLSITASVRAGTIGLIIVLLFMAVYYRLPGGLADLALLFYALLNFAIFKWIGVTLTLPAIAGFLLSTGMAVDANILVFERMKEELRRGFNLTEAIDAGFNRAWSSIRDSNVATLIVCAILFSFGRNFGASIVQGFAITLAIGVGVSMFTAVTVTRTLVRLVMGGAASRWIEKRSWLRGD